MADISFIELTDLRPQNDNAAEKKNIVFGIVIGIAQKR
jgi:hypothetical protein